MEYQTKKAKLRVIARRKLKEDVVNFSKRVTVGEFLRRAKKAGVPIAYRTLRNYIGLGLIPYPEKRGRYIGYYNSDHIERIKLIQKLTGRFGFTLKDLQKINLDLISSREPSLLNRFEKGKKGCVFGVWKSHFPYEKSLFLICLSRKKANEIAKAKGRGYYITQEEII